MKSVIAQQGIKKIEDTIVDVKNIETVGISMLNSSYLAKFLIVYISGLFEKIIKGILADRASFSGDPEFASFITKFRWYNPKFKNILSLLGSFNKSWVVELKKIDYECKDAITSIVNNKNELAHGGEVTATLNDVYLYYDNSKKIIEKIDKIVLGV